jgi:predicted dehydrogenase
VLKVAVGRDAGRPARTFADTWGWEETPTDWREVVVRDDVDVVDISVPTTCTPRSRSLAAEAGKHVFCEKPMALDLREARAMLDAATGRASSTTSTTTTAARRR